MPPRTRQDRAGRAQTSKSEKRIGSVPERLLEAHLAAAKVPPYEREYRFHQTRRWRADFAWPDYRLLVEVEGGVWIAGRHNRGSGFEADCHKYNAAALLGYRVLRFTPRMVRDGTALAAISAVVLEEMGS